MPRYRVDLTYTEYGTSTATVTVDAIDERHARSVARQEADFSGSDTEWSGEDDVEVDNVEEIESNDEEEPDDDDK